MTRESQLYYYYILCVHNLVVCSGGDKTITGKGVSLIRFALKPAVIPESHFLISKCITGPRRQ